MAVTNGDLDIPGRAPRHRPHRRRSAPRTPAAQRAPSLEGLERRLRAPAAPGGFDERELTGLPGPVARYFRASIAPGAPLAQAARLHMRGRLKLNDRWLPFRARQVLAPHHGLLWRARVAGVISGSDRCADGWARLHWKVLGVLTVAHEEGFDVARSSAGRAAGEAIWLPTALLPRFGVEWAASDDHHLTARLSTGGVESTLHLGIDTEGHLESMRMDRWGDPDRTGTWDLHPFKFTVTRTGSFGSLSIPAAGSAGWFPATGRRHAGEFIRCDITALEPISDPPHRRRP